VVAGHALTSGQIPRLTDFEKPPAAARLEAGTPHSGCEASLHFPPGTLQVEAMPGELVSDIFWGEHATAYHVKNRGLVIISSCGYAGIINSIRQIQKIIGSAMVHAVAGGGHLAPPLTLPWPPYPRPARALGKSARFFALYAQYPFQHNLRKPCETFLKG
jgi:7,8-dihydropterin-6-yl-methyl-4-(beta-D-ribofuranosyl)aminobenzene 5'-phosphate synthase